MMKHIQTIRQMLSKNCLNVFDHFVGLALKQFSEEIIYLPEEFPFSWIIFYYKWMPQEDFIKTIPTKNFSKIKKINRNF